MKVRKTFVALFASVFSVAFVLLLTVFAAAACSERVTLRFVTGEGTHLSSVEGQAGRSYEKPNDPELAGYYFDGWFLSSDCSGEKQTLPDVMPGESVTYYAKYAKYPVLSLDPCGGTLSQTELLVKPGELLSESLKEVLPQKAGLLFGGWERGGELLPADAVMPDGDLSLSARYKAQYTVDVYLQAADDPEKFLKSEELSLTGSDWEGSDFCADKTPPAHFLYDGHSRAEGRLGAGENNFELYFTRETFTVTLSEARPNGESAREEILTRYGAHLFLPDPQEDGYEFLCWRDNTGEEHPAAAEMTLNGPLALSGVWGKGYPNARGEGTLYAEVGDAPLRKAVLEKDGVRTDGEFHAENGVFHAGVYGGKLEPHGGFLPDDSGTYMGCDLNLNGTEELGVLTLDFFGGSAKCRIGEDTLEGSYVSLYDEEKGVYTGEYSFETAGGFDFRLYGTVFLREGEEAGDYLLYDPQKGEFEALSLSLDGYGGAVLRGETETHGNYRRGERDWLFTPVGGEAVRFLLGRRVWSDEADFAGEDAFLFGDDALLGVYRAQGGETLTLDGYGLAAAYESGGQTLRAPFMREGDVVTLFSDPVLRFTLNGEKFSPTSEEAGSYDGEKGTLVLDGAHGAKIYQGGVQIFGGSYEKSETDWVFEGEILFKFRLQGENYRVYDGAKRGEFEAYYGPALSLDGYGGGTYRPVAGDPVEVELLYREEGFFLLYSPALNTPFHTAAFRADGEGFLAEIQGAEAGIYPVCENGAPTGERLLFDGMGKVTALGKGVSGSYTYSHKRREAVCVWGGTAYSFRLLEENGMPYCARSLAAGVYTGEEGTLTLDGYGNALFSETLSLPYLFRGGAAELYAETELLRFTLTENGYTLEHFRRYTNPDGAGTLYLGERVNAILRAEKDYFGSYGLGTFLAEGRSFPFRLRGEEFYPFDEAQTGEYGLQTGERLVLDGCGFARLLSEEETLDGKGVLEDGYLRFQPFGQAERGYAFENGVLVPLGEEFGKYAGEEGTLFLHGDGTASLTADGRTFTGTYAQISQDVYKISVHGGFCAKIARGEMGWERCEETLFAYAGEYSAEGGTLFVDGCHIRLAAGDGAAEYAFVCACDGGFLARDTLTGGYVRIRFAENRASLSAAESRFLAFS